MSTNDLSSKPTVIDEITGPDESKTVSTAHVLHSEFKSSNESCKLGEDCQFTQATLTQFLGRGLFTQSYSDLHTHAQALATQPNLRHVLVEIVLASRRRHEDPAQDRVITTAASNAISILNYGARKGLFPFRLCDVRDWSGIRVPGANLNYAMLAHCNFDNADLSGASISHVNLYASTLRKANLQGVVMQQLKIGYAPDDGSASPIAVNPNGRNYVTVSRTGFSVRSISTPSATTFESSSQRHDEMSVYNIGHGVNGFDFSPDGEYLAVAHHTSIWFYRTKDVEQDGGEAVARFQDLADVVSGIKFSPDSQRLASYSRGRVLMIFCVRTQHINTISSDYPVSSVDWSPDGRRIASVGFNGALEILDAETGECVAHFAFGAAFREYDKRVLTCGRFSSNGKQFVAGVSTGEIAIFGAEIKEPTILPGHVGAITDVVFDCTGNRMFSASYDMTIRVWDLVSNQSIATLVEHSGPVTDICLTPDGNTLISASQDATHRLWDVSNIPNTMLTFQGHATTLHCLAFAPDSRYLASGAEDGMICIWDTAMGQLVSKLAEHTCRVLSLSFATDGKTLASTEYDGKSIWIWDIATSQRTTLLDGHTGCVLAVCFSPMGQYLASGSDDLSIRLWDMVSHKCVGILVGHENPIQALAFCSDGRLLASGGQRIRIWDIQAQRCLRIIGGHETFVTSLQFSRCGQYLASGGSGEVGNIHVWEVETGKCITTHDGHEFDVRCMSFHVDGQRVASCGSDRTIRIWNSLAKNDDPVLYTGETDINSVCFSPDGNMLASASLYNGIQLWQVPQPIWTGRCVTKTDFIGTKAMAASQDGRWVVCAASDNDVSVQDLTADDQPPRLFSGHFGIVTCCAFSPNNEWFVTGSYDSTLRLWTTRSQDQSQDSCKLLLDGHAAPVRCVTVSSDGHLILSGSSDKTVRLWNSLTGTCVATLEGHDSEVAFVSFTPDGAFAASAGVADPYVRVWEVDNAACVVTLEMGTEGIFDMQFASDSKRLVTGSYDAIRVWDISTQQCLATLKDASDTFVCFNMTPNVSKVVTGSDENRTFVWDVTTGERRLLTRSGEGVGSRTVCFTNWGHYIVSGSADHTIRIWDAITYKLLHELIGHSASVEDVKIVSEHADDRMVIASTSRDCTSHIWFINELHPIEDRRIMRLVDVLDSEHRTNFLLTNFAGATMDPSFESILAGYLTVDLKYPDLPE